LKGLLKDDDDCDYDFTMCNPPFYSNEDDFNGHGDNVRSPTKRQLNRHSLNNSKCYESIYDDGQSGGECNFVKKMIDQSIEIGQRIK
jgi:23S rRNA A1618 N6-methylase RlmF